MSGEEKSQKLEEKSQKIQENQLKQAIVQEINEIKQDIFAEKSKDMQQLRLLGDLLRYLRTNKSMPLLMLCRQIQTIEVDGSVALIYSEDDSIGSLVSNEKYKAELDAFFKQNGLSFKIKEKEHKVSAGDILNEMIGGKLVIK